MTDQVQSAAGVEPFDLILRQRVVRREFHGLAVSLVENTGHRVVRCQVGQAADRDGVAVSNRVPRGRIVEGEREDALLLQVRLMDAGERLCEHRVATAKAWFHRCVLTTRALANVLLADEDPVDALFVEVLGNLGVGLGLAVGWVDRAFADSGLRVYDAEVEVARNVFEVSSVLQPWTSHRNVVGRDLADALAENR